MVLHTSDEHLHRLEEVLLRLQQANIKISYLGHVISSGIIQPDPNKIHAIVNYPRPTVFFTLSAQTGTPTNRPTDRQPNSSCVSLNEPPQLVRHFLYKQSIQWSCNLAEISNEVAII